jgi:hypothetical protein
MEITGTLSAQVESPQMTVSELNYTNGRAIGYPGVEDNGNSVSPAQLFYVLSAVWERLTLTVTSQPHFSPLERSPSFVL